MASWREQMEQQRARLIEQDRARISLIEGAARLDDTLTLSLALHYGRDPTHVLSLLDDVIWRAPIDVRIRLLDEALWRTDLHDEVPFLEPRLRMIFRMRNLVAHGVLWAESDTGMTFATTRNGKRAHVDLRLADLTAATVAAERCLVHFGRIEARIGDVSTWASLYGLDVP